jgi:hypothetical protein
MIQIRLAIRDGGHVADVIIPPFVSLPEVVVWGERFFLFHHEIKNDGDPCAAEYRECFAYWVPPAMTVPDAPAGQEPGKG